MHWGKRRPTRLPGSARRIAVASLVGTSLSVAPHIGATNVVRSSGPRTPRWLPAAPTAPVTVANVQATIRSQEQLGVEQALTAAQDAFGSDYSGAWVDNANNTSTLVVQIARASSQAEVMYAHNVSAHTYAHTRFTIVPYSDAQLKAYELLLQKALGASPTFRNSSVHPWSLDIDSIDDSVQVGVAPSDRTSLAAILPGVPRAALRLTDVGTMAATSGPGWTTGVNAETFPPYKAGLAVYTNNNVTGDSDLCTSGFLLEVAGSYKGVIAGHCAQDNPTGYVSIIGSGTTVGQGDGVTAFGSGGDYWVFSLSNQSSSDWIGRILSEVNPQPGTDCTECYTPASGANGFLDDVVGRVPSSQQVDGVMACHAGVSSDSVSCATIDGQDQVKTYNGETVSGLTCAGWNSQKGDSGGPVYGPVPGNEGTAMGVMDETGHTFWGAQSCWTPIDTVLQALTAKSNQPAYVVGADGSLY